MVAAPPAPAPQSPVYHPGPSRNEAPQPATLEDKLRDIFE